jgi:transposase
MTLVTTTIAMPCPLCGRRTTRVHSRYVRKLSDLPWAGRTVRLTLHVRKFFCSASSCPRRIFTERLPSIAEPYAQKTIRLTELLRLVGFATGGELGARLSHRLSLPASPRTLLRLVRSTPLVPPSTPRVLGIDDWSFRRGRRFGTILVDLEEHRPVDLLPESSEAVVTAWLQEHPGVEIISRDRGDAYQAAATQAAPQALQIADRWHLLKNLGDALQTLLTRHTAALRKATHPTASDAPEASPQDVLPPLPPPTSRPRSPKAALMSAQREWQLATYQQVRELATHGWSVAAIARKLEITKQTVRKYRDMDTFLDRRISARPSLVEPYRAYVEQRWAAGCTEVKQLWDELQGQGFAGGYKSVWNFVRGWSVPSSVAGGAALAIKVSKKVRTPRKVMWLLLEEPEQVDEADAAYRAALYKLCPELERAFELAQEFRRLVRERTTTELGDWLRQAEGSGVRELRRFALSLRQDEKAVQAALVYPWSQGQTEGQVTRLKELKRAMYGRSNFDLLRLRMLHPV